jgi:hypothetical protein
MSNVFNELYHPEDHPIETRLVSKATDKNGNPLIEIQPSSSSPSTLILKFIRSNPPQYTFDILLKDLLCYAVNNGYTKVELEDDAMFTNGQCTFRSLIYRAFENKDSIYINKGFQPKLNVETMKNILYNYTIGDAKNLTTHLPPEIRYRILAIPSDKNDDRFGTWLLNNDCFLVREVLNRIESLTKKIDSLNNLTSSSKEFLKAYKDYYNAHQYLSKDAQCPKNESISNGGRSRLRCLSRSSSRKRRQCRKTRKSRRYRKTSKKGYRIK